MKLSVVTVTYKSDPEELDLFIKSFLKYNDLQSEADLIIVDNSPSDYLEVRDVVSSFEKEDVVYIPNPSNPGFGASNNVGFRYQPSDYVLFVNNDVEFTEPVFRKLIGKMESDASIGCIGIHQTGGAPSFFNKMTAPKGCQMKTFDEKCHFISGAFMFFRSDIFTEIGMFDEMLFMYFEEFDLSERLIKNGYSTQYLPELSFLHKVGDRKRVNDKVWIKAIPSFCHICRKYNIDPAIHSRGLMKRLRLLFLYHVCLFHWLEAKKILHVYRKRQQIIYKEFGIKIY